MPIIDAQLHAYERDHPGRPWHAVLTGPPRPPAIRPSRCWTKQASTARSWCRRSRCTATTQATRSRCAIVTRTGSRWCGRSIPPTRPSPKSSRSGSAYRARSACACCWVRSGLATDAADPGLNRVLKEAARLSLPVNLHIAGRLDQGIELIRRNPDTQIIVDHLGLVQPHVPPKPSEPWADAEGAYARQTSACRHEDHRRLHAVAKLSL